MNKRCSNCRFWGDKAAPEYNGTIWTGLRYCTITSEREADDASDWQVVATTNTGYPTDFLTRADFGCTLFEPKII